MTTVSICPCYQTNIFFANRIIAGITALLVPCVCILHFNWLTYWGFVYGVVLLIGAVLLVVSTFRKYRALYLAYECIIACNVIGLFITVGKSIGYVIALSRDNIIDPPKEKRDILRATHIFIIVASIICALILIWCGYIVKNGYKLLKRQGAFDGVAELSHSNI
ncbi:unnamed protein product [Bursaphelenchus xylophilus]|uniref:(pine wood nematode) hypothetical protein n=1 Tax=Bursaphelenchus xylophilus TaxID=6326 RepID=A0A1I7RZY1_BURXY|nr:unnamed protein product [Bursaphelenchus xylophilus]CAG9109154.1 unnamed protein product [Bursaphelenchus xylophilus]